MLFASTGNLHGQSLSGTVTDENGEPIPYANVFVKELSSGTSCDFEGKFFLSLVSEGEYSVVVTAIGYESKNVSAVLRKPVDFKIYAVLETSSVQMNEVVVRAQKRDPAFGIIKKVIDNKKKYIHPVSSSTSEIYLKSYEKLDIAKKKK